MPAINTYGKYQAPLLLHSAPVIPTVVSTSPTSVLTSSPSHIHPEEPVLIEIPNTIPDLLQDSGESDNLQSFHGKDCAPTPTTHLSTHDYNFHGLSLTSTFILDLMSIPRRIGIAVLSLCLSYATFFSIFTLLNPKDILNAEAQENYQWIATSRSWVDRSTCKWAGMCGVNHWRSRLRMEHRHGKLWHDAGSQPSKWSHDELVSREIPQFVFDHAPFVYLFSEEQYWPCDIADHLHHVTPKLNYTSIQEHSPNLTELDQLNEWNRGRFVYLTSDDDPELGPEWLSGKENVPEKSSTKDEVHGDSDQWDGRVEGEVLDSAAKREGWYEAGEGNSQKLLGRNARPLGVMDSFFDGGSVGKALHEAPPTQKGKSPLKRQIVGGRSNAPAVLIVVNKGNGIVDAFWFFFYSFNLGNKVLNIRFGNHVGDWEHTMVRFQHGKPKAVYFSEHNFGSAYSYDAVEKIGKRVSKYANQLEISRC